MISTRLTRIRKVVALAAVAMAFALPVSLANASPASAQTTGSSGSDNTAIAINTKDGSSLFKFAFSITKANGAVADAGNAAVAYASCVECQTVAVAIQFVIVEGSPNVFTPENVAIAINQSCTLCDTMALAYQVVIQTSGPVRLSEDGRAQMQELVKELRKLEKEGLTNAALFPQVEAIFKQMVDVMSTQLVPVGPDAGGAAAPTGEPGETTTTTTVVQNSSTTTSTTQVVQSTTTTAPRTSSTTTSTPSSTTSTPSSTTSTSTTSAPTTTTSTTPTP